MSGSDEARLEQRRAEREPAAVRPIEAAKDTRRGQSVSGVCRSRRGAAVVNRSSGD